MGSPYSRIRNALHGCVRKLPCQRSDVAYWQQNLHQVRIFADTGKDIGIVLGKPEAHSIFDLLVGSPDGDGDAVAL